MVAKQRLQVGGCNSSSPSARGGGTLGVQVNNLCVLIPAYRPSRRLVEIVEQLISNFSCYVVVVDDGSGAEFTSVFTECAALQRTAVIRNAINLGKGAALKNGINYILTHFEKTIGIVTADADGQHATSDIISVAKFGEILQSRRWECTDTPHSGL